MKRIVKKREVQIFSVAAMLLAIMFLMVILPGCGKKKPIKVGFSGCLTGRLSDLGTAGRNGVILAVEQINEAGGINGRPVELIVKDDKQDPEVAVQVDKDLIEEEVVAIIGHMTSAMSMTAVPLINEKKMLMISPTTSTNELTGIDDYFLRLTPPSKIQTDHLAHHTFEKMELRKIAGVYDLSNQAFAEGLYKNFKTEFENRKGRVVFTETFTSGKEISYLDLARNLLNSGPDGLIIVAGALDTAMICQQVRKLGSDVPIVSSAWAKTSDLIQHGGSAVEGLTFSQRYDPTSKHEQYLTFKQQFNERFGTDPSFAAEYSYETAQILFDALSRNGTGGKLRGTIINHTFQGLQEEISIDQYGDTRRKRSIITVKNGQFITVE